MNGSSPEPAKIVRVIGRLNVGGPAIQAINLSAKLDNSYSTTLVVGAVGENEGSFEWLAAEQEVALTRMPSLGREISPLKDTRTLVELVRLLRRLRPVIVHTHTAKAGFVGRMAAWLARVPVTVHTFHGHVFHSYFGSSKSRLFVAIERFLARRTTRIIAISERQKDELLQYGVGKPDQVDIVPLGFDLEPFSRSTGREAVRAQLGLPEDCPVVGIVARLTAVKNIRFFLEVASAIRAGHPSVRFLVVGDGELREELNEEARGLGLAQVVHFTGWKKDVAPIYQAMDVVVLTSDNEGTPVSLIEAMASARPVVATDVGGVRDVVQSEATGFVVPKGDLSGFAGAVSFLLEDDELRTRLGARGREEALSRFGLDRLVSDIEALYGQLHRDLRAAHAR